MTELLHKNMVTMVGTAAGTPLFSHENQGGRFDRLFLRIQRLSGQTDEVRVVAEEKILGNLQIEEGKRICVMGQIRSYNNKTGKGNKLVISVYARSVCICDEEDCNEVLLSGTVCKKPVRRSTPLGREICDVLLAVNRRYGRADYIPCIGWGVIASEISTLNVGDMLSFWGRLQSRRYRKQTEEGTEQRTAYEVSIMTLMWDEQLEDMG